MPKPHLVLIDGKPHVSRSAAVENARRRYGKPFANEPGSTFKKRETPLLSEWLAGRINNKPKKE